MQVRRAGAIVLLVTAVCVASAGCAGAMDVEADASGNVGETVTVSVGSIAETVSAQGNVQSEREASLVFATSGRIAEILVDEGDWVNKGDALGRIDGVALERQVSSAEGVLQSAHTRLAQASVLASEAEIASAQAAVDSARAGVDSAQARLDQLLNGPSDLDLRAAELSIERAKDSLWSAQAQRDAVGGVSGPAKDSAEAQVLIAEVGVREAELARDRMLADPTEEEITISQAAVQQAYAQLQQAEAQLSLVLDRPRPEDVAVAEAQVNEAELTLKHAEDALDDLAITAPFSGVVTSVSLNEGEWANASVPVIQIADSEHVVLPVWLDEVDVSQLAVGQEAVLSFDALSDRTVNGIVESVAPSATQTASGIAYRVEIRFSPGDLPVKLGMTASADIVTQSVPDALLVPSRAIVVDRDAGTYTVLKQTGTGEAEEIQVQIGLRDGSSTQIVSGLAEGDVLVLPEYDLEASGTGDDMWFGGTAGSWGGGGR